MATPPTSKLPPPDLKKLEEQVQKHIQTVHIMSVSTTLPEDMIQIAKAPAPAKQTPGAFTDLPCIV